MTDLGYAVRLRLLEVLDGPAVTGIDQFTLLLKERGRSGPSTLAEGGYTVYHRAIGNYPFFLMQAQSSTPLHHKFRDALLNGSLRKRFGPPIPGLRLRLRISSGAASSATV